MSEEEAKPKLEGETPAEVPTTAEEKKPAAAE
jgi:hypothetical protein